MPSEIAVPFRLDGNGHIVKLTDPDAQVRQHVLALLNTNPMERAMVPGYGVDLTPLVFADDPDEVATQISLRARTAVSQYEPGVELISVDAAGDTEGAQYVAVEYRRLDAPDSASVANVNRAIIGVGGDIRDMVRG